MHNALAHFTRWYDDARAHPGVEDVTAMTLATATRDGRPSARIVLLKEYGENGFVFYTNLNSRKGQELAENPHAALCFYWIPLARQVRVEGSIAAVSEAEADAYFASRPRARQLGAWASLQSSPLASRAELENRLAEMEKKFAGGEVPRPSHWSGWRLTPESIEFWQNDNARLHEREIYRRTPSGQWQHGLMFP
jgi:pyridoxamine 5'-phosphate oxidase